MKVCISCLFVGLDLQGGLQERLKALMTGLCKRGHRVIIVQCPFAHANSKEFLDQYDKCDLDSISTGNRYASGLSLNDMIRSSLYKTIEAVANDVEVIDSYDPYLIIPRDRPALVHSSNFYVEYVLRHFRLTGWNYQFLHILNLLLRQPIIRAADTLVVENSIEKEYLVRWNRIDPDRIKVVLPGYDQNFVQKLGVDAAKSRESKRIVFSGRLNALKGIYELVDALKIVHARFPEWRLLLIGGGDSREDLESYVARAGLSAVVDFCGMNSYEDTLKLMNTGEIVVLPTYIEGIPLAVIEGMALGKAVVATNVGAISTHLIEHGKTGLLVRPKDAHSLSQALEFLVANQDIRTKLADNGRERASTLTFDRMVDDTLVAYSQAIARRKLRFASQHVAGQFISPGR